MDNNNKNKKKDIDLSSFDLEPFKEYFEEEDAQKAVEEKAKQEKIIREETKKAIALKAEKEARLRKKQEEARRAAEKKARLKAKERAERERREAELAAKKEAQAIADAKRAEELEVRAAAERAAQEKAKAADDAQNANETASEENSETNEEKAAKLLEHVQDDEAVVPESSEEDGGQADDKISSILAISHTDEETGERKRERIELADDFFDYSPEMESPRGGLYSAICAVLIIAFLACTAFAGYTYFFADKKGKVEASNTQYVGSSPEYSPFDGLQAKYPAAVYPAGISDELKGAFSQNSNMVGWLTIDGTPIDYPIVKTTDNYHYLNYSNFYNKAARFGTPFMDFRCDANNLSKNTVIYSHHMNNEMDFGSLDKYTNSNYYKEHPYISYQTLRGNLTYKVYAVFYATTQAESDGGFVFDYYNPDMGDENFKGYIELLNQYAIYTTDAGLEATDRIITLSTCSHVYDNLRTEGVDTRLVVVGRLLRDGEKADTGNETAQENSDYRRPQLWYDQNKKDNPYAAYRTWRAAL